MKKILMALIIVLVCLGGIVQAQQGQLEEIWANVRPSGMDSSVNFNNPKGIALDTEGNLYVADGMNGIWKLDAATGEILGQIVDFNMGDPVGLAVDPATRNLYAADPFASGVVVYAPDGTHQFSIVSFEGAMFSAASPRDLALSDSAVYAGDYDAATSISRIHVYTLDGEYTQTWDVSELRGIPLLDVAPDGNLYVTTTGKPFMVIAPDGTKLQTDFAAETVADKFVYGIDIAPDGTIYALSRSDGILVISPTGELLRTYRPYDDGNPDTNALFEQAEAIVVGEDGTIYLAGLSFAEGNAGVVALRQLEGVVTSEPPAAPPAVEATPEAAAPETGLGGSVEVSGDPVRQWAQSATGTSQYDVESWSFSQATGAPNTTECGDIVTAWASATSTGSDTLELSFKQAVIPAQVNIYQTYNPGSIIRVELTSSATNTAIEVPDSADPPGNTSCPGVFTLDISGVDTPVDGVVIYFDQTVGGSWNEIDAVELVGIPAGGSPSDLSSMGSDGGQSFSAVDENTGREISLSYPAGWVAEQDSGFILVGTSSDVLGEIMSEQPEFAAGEQVAGIIFFVQAEMPPDSTLQSAFDLLAEAFTGEGDYTVGTPEAVTLGKNATIKATLAGPGFDGMVYVMEIDGEFGLLLLMGNDDPAALEANGDLIAGSITLK